jgi:hypothetical protein
MYIPPGWWHAMQSEDKSFSVSMFVTYNTTDLSHEGSLFHTGHLKWTILIRCDVAKTLSPKMGSSVLHSPHVQALGYLVLLL